MMFVWEAQNASLFTELRKPNASVLGGEIIICSNINKIISDVQFYKHQKEILWSLEGIKSPQSFQLVLSISHV